jgi:hypothetical protein
MFTREDLSLKEQSLKCIKKHKNVKPLLEEIKNHSLHLRSLMTYECLLRPQPLNQDYFKPLWAHLRDNLTCLNKDKHYTHSENQVL